MKRLFITGWLVFTFACCGIARADTTPAPTVQPAASPAAPKSASPSASPSAVPSASPAASPTPNRARCYGWLQQGFTANFANPHDHVNYGVNFNWQANSYQLNQAYVVFERVLDQTPKGNFGYRVDVMGGQDAPFLVSNGLFSSFTGFDPTSGFGNDGAGSFRRMDRIGIDTPQFYLDIHMPGFLTKSGTDLRIGKFYTLMGREVYPGKDTDFYSRTFENVVATPYTHTGFLATVHASSTWDVVAGVVRGWDVFRDNNHHVSFHGAFIWNSPDSRYNWTTCWITGPEQPHNDVNFRTLFSSYYTAKIGKGDKWTFSGGGHYGFEPHGAVDPATGATKFERWYGLSANLFYDINSKWRLGFRQEWFRDEGGARTAFFGRPGYNSGFFDSTFGVTYRATPSVRIRPELRADWATHAHAYNDQKSSSQFTPGVDVIWEF